MVKESKTLHSTTLMVTYSLWSQLVMMVLGGECPRGSEGDGISALAVDDDDNGENGEGKATRDFHRRLYQPR